MALDNQTGGRAGVRTNIVRRTRISAANAASSVRIARRRLQEYLEDQERSNVMFQYDLDHLARVLSTLDRAQRQLAELDEELSTWEGKHG